MERRYGDFILVILMGVVMSLGVVAKRFFEFDLDSDWFWFMAGVGLAVEGVISFRRQRRFDNKYKVVKREGR